VVAGVIVNLATSPNGNRVVYQQIINRRSDLVVMSITGRGRKNITRTATISEAQPTWVNNLTVAYARKVSKWAIYRMPATGGRSVRVTSPTLNCQQPAYSPTGGAIACITRTATRNYLRTMTARGLRVRTLGVVRTLPSQPVWANTLVVAFTTN
jgi:Tol biopolymer transport system component